jgi:hypothetical protein
LKKVCVAYFIGIHHLHFYLNWTSRVRKRRGLFIVALKYVEIILRSA